MIEQSYVFFEASRGLSEVTPQAHAQQIIKMIPKIDKDYLLLINCPKLLRWLSKEAEMTKMKNWPNRKIIEQPYVFLEAPRGSSELTPRRTPVKMSSPN